MADEPVEETDASEPELVSADDRVIRHLRNDLGSPSKWPTIGIGRHEPGEVLPISLRRDEPIPFGYTEVKPKKGEDPSATSSEGTKAHRAAAADTGASASGTAASEGAK